MASYLSISTIISSIPTNPSPVNTQLSQTDCLPLPSSRSRLLFINSSYLLVPVLLRRNPQYLFVCVCVRACKRVCTGAQSLSRVWLIVTPRTVAHQAPLSMQFSRQEYWSGLIPGDQPGDQPGDLPHPSIEPMSLASPALAGGFFPTAPPGKPIYRVSGCSVLSETNTGRASAQADSKVVNGGQEMGLSRWWVLSVRTGKKLPFPGSLWFCRCSHRIPPKAELQVEASACTNDSL